MIFRDDQVKFKIILLVQLKFIKME